MRILYFIDSLRAGGKERQLLELLKGLKKNNTIDILVVVLEKDTYFQKSFEELKVNLVFLERKIKWDLFLLKKFDNIVSEFCPDIIHTFEWVCSFYAIPSSKIRKIILVNGSIRNAFNRGGVRWYFEKFFLLLSNIRIANSKAGLNSRGLEEDSIKNFVIYNGFDFKRTAKLDQSFVQNLQKSFNNMKIVGMVATYKNHKDYSTFFSSAKLILKKRGDVIFLSVGDGDNFMFFKEQLESNYDGKIFFLGRQHKIEEIISLFNIGILSTYTEGISNSIMEYMALRKPVIAADCPGNRDCHAY